MAVPVPPVSVLSARSAAGSVFGTMLMVIGLLLLRGAVGADINIRKIPLSSFYSNPPLFQKTNFLLFISLGK